MRATRHVPVARVGDALLISLLLLAGLYAAGSCLDLLASISNPGALDYGEGIVWQQALLIPGPRMYSASTALPFVVFHYPPLYYCLVQAMRLIIPDYLAAGRAVAVLSTFALAPLVTGLVLAASGARSWREPRVLAVAVLAGLVVLGLHPIRIWGMFMRVDMPGVALGLAGMLVAARSHGRFLWITAGLALCAAAVFTKQTFLAPGIAVTIVMLFHRPGATLAAAALVAALSLGVVLLLQVQTEGGFLQNIIGYNINRMSLSRGLALLRSLRQSSVLALLAGSAVAFQLFRMHRRSQAFASNGSGTAARMCRQILLVHFAVCVVGLATIFKVGSALNYFIEPLCSACVVVGFTGVDLARGRYGWSWYVAMPLLALAVVTGTSRRPEERTMADVAAEQSLIRLIAAADRPVASDNMVLLMRAGKPVIFESAIVTELAMVGRWDQGALLDMIRAHGFAFMLTDDDDTRPSDHRTPAVVAAMREAYPRVVRAPGKLWMHTEAASDFGFGIKEDAASR